MAPDAGETASEGPLSGVKVCIDPGHQAGQVKAGRVEQYPGAGKLVSELSVAINVADGSVYAARIDKDFTLRQVSVPIPEETENEAEVRRLAGFAALGTFFRLVKERFELWLALRLDAEKWLKETALIRTAVGRASR